MSRSAYIWVVADATPVPVAAFTVKHELAGWLERRQEGRSGLRITRLRDGRTPSEAVALDPTTLEPTLDQPADSKEG